MRGKWLCKILGKKSVSHALDFWFADCWWYDTSVISAIWLFSRAITAQGNLGNIFK